VIQIFHLVAQNICNNLGDDPRNVHGQLMTFDTVAEPHAVLFCADGEIPGDRRAGTIDGCRGGACDAVGLAESPGRCCCHIAYDAPSFGHGRRDQAPCTERYLCGGGLKLWKNTSAVYLT